MYNICDFDHVGFVMVHSYISTFSLRLTQEALMYYICDFDHVHFVMVHSYITTFTLWRTQVAQDIFLNLQWWLYAGKHYVQG